MAFESDRAPGLYQYDDPPPWFDTAALACSFGNRPGADDGPDARQACEYLEAAGIPTYLTTDKSPADDPDSNPMQDYQVYVPGPLALKATSVLDIHIFNAGAEDLWRTHLETLTDEDLHAVTPDIVCAGLQDRIVRLTRACEEEIARRAILPLRSSSSRPA